MQLRGERRGGARFATGSRAASRRYTARHHPAHGSQVSHQHKQRGRRPSGLAPAPSRQAGVFTVALTALTALALNRALGAYAGSVCWTGTSPGDWITTAALSYIGADIILHVAIGLR